MVEQRSDDDQLSGVLKATSDPTRRAILTTLVQEGPTRVTDLAAYFDMSLNSVSKHIKVLESAGLVSRRTIGRTHIISAEMGPVSLIDTWFSDLRSTWEMRLEQLDAMLKENRSMDDMMVTVNRRISAPVETVFNAWLDPEMLARFMLPGDGMSVPKAVSDARVGGRFTIIMAAGDDEIPHGGEYRAIDRHSKLVFTWESPFSIDGSTVTLNFADAGGATDLELIHVKFPSEESRNNHEGGWNAILNKLSDVMS